MSTAVKLGEGAGQGQAGRLLVYAVLGGEPRRAGSGFLSAVRAGDRYAESRSQRDPGQPGGVPGHQTA